MHYDLSLPPPRRSLSRVDDIRDAGGQPEIQDVVALLEGDPITTIHLLRQVNSPIYSLRQSVSSLERAATMLGFDAVANTIFVESMTDRPAELETEAGRLVYAYLVRTSVASGFIADALSHFLRMDQHGAVRTAALVHQIGRMALLSTDPETYVGLWNRTTTADGKPTAIPPGIGREIVHFRTDYTRHGENIAKHWKLPPTVIAAARYHADPERADEGERNAVRVVAVSAYAARTMAERDDDLDRDQSTDRVAKALAALSRSFEVGQKQLEAFLEDAKRPAYRNALDVVL